VRASEPAQKQLCGALECTGDPPWVVVDPETGDGDVIASDAGEWVWLPAAIRARRRGGAVVTDHIFDVRCGLDMDLPK
jgi:hypothetical protein